MNKNSERKCSAENIAAVQDALYVLNGKWRLPIITVLEHGPMRFGEIQRELSDITPKVLSKELRELELNRLIERKVFSSIPVVITYELMPYSNTLEPILEHLTSWGKQHRKKIVEEWKAETLLRQ
ncbi:MAG TPA: helix-turn-helix domain-containing protein [Arachidicoccus sp.]